MKLKVGVVEEGRVVDVRIYYCPRRVSVYERNGVVGISIIYGDLPDNWDSFAVNAESIAEVVIAVENEEMLSVRDWEEVRKEIVKKRLEEMGR